MKEFDEFLKDVKKSTELDPWVKDRGLKRYCSDLPVEGKEVLEALDNKDNVELKEELGDILYLWAHICRLAEEEGMFSAKDVILAAEKKLLNRKPYILEGRKVSVEEAVRIWFDAKRKEKEDEYVYHVDENDNVLGKVARKDAIAKNLWHRGTGIMVQNSKGDILIHKRTMDKDRFAGFHDIWFGGWVIFNESYDENAYRELFEETGIKAKPEFLFHLKFSGETNVHSHMYRVRSDGPFSFQESEVEKALFVSVEKLKEMIKIERFCPDGLKGFEMFLKWQKTNQ